jgi:hypothetical protein
MAVRPISDRRINALRGRPLEGRISEACRARAEAAYDLLADIQSHLEWGGTRRSKSSRLLSIDAPDGAAEVGTEFASTGEDSIGRMSDRSVVTEAVPPQTLEFVTESLSRFKRGGNRVDWTLVHRYDVTPDPAGCRITYTLRATRATSLPGPLAIFRIAALRSIALWMLMGRLRGGLRNLVRMAEERAGRDDASVRGRPEKGGP